MNETQLRSLLGSLVAGKLKVEQALEQLRNLPLEQLDCARLDHHRQLRTGLPEAVFGENKTSEQLLTILTAMLEKDSIVLATRISPEKAAPLQHKLTGLTYHPEAAILTGNEQYIERCVGQGEILIITAGTSDIRVAEEARISLQMFGNTVDTIYDAGVAGIHRILAHSKRLQRAAVLIVVAGMEGALPSVVAGMTAAPVIGVPSSVGYGAGTGGFSALLGMLNSCAPGLAVVNIDNGFGAACMAAAINRRKIEKK
jgi:NCAIR mutase (PurE)-related protein